MTYNNNIIFNTTNTHHIQQTLINWFTNINPQYFLTIQLPQHLRSESLTTSNKKLLEIMSTFERLLWGRHWNRKHTPFIAIAENGKKSFNWHYHILIYNCSFNFFQLQSVFDRLLLQLHLPFETIHFESIITSGVNSYASKEIFADVNGHFDTDRIITSEILFNLPHKITQDIPKQHINTPWILRNTESDKL
ncbi:MAG: hypothetical protein MJ170_03960 [Alphaproteobacteria bacterium]|nr:hypothetical protein [Alphaproteobacteria bacterium]